MLLNLHTQRFWQLWDFTNIGFCISHLDQVRAFRHVSDICVLASHVGDL
jgi:hypothetical protein